MRWHTPRFEGDCFRAASRILLVKWLDAMAFGTFRAPGSLSLCIIDVCFCYSDFGSLQL